MFFDKRGCGGGREDCVKVSLPGQRQAGRECSSPAAASAKHIASWQPNSHPPGAQTLLYVWHSEGGASLLGEGHPSWGRGLHLGGGTLYSAASLPTLGVEPLSILREAGSQPKSGAATTDPEAGQRTHQPGLSTRILLWSQSRTQRGAHTAKGGLEVWPGCGLEVWPGSGVWCAQRDRPEEQGFT